MIHQPLPAAGAGELGDERGDETKQSPMLHRIEPGDRSDRRKDAAPTSLEHQENQHTRAGESEQDNQVGAERTPIFHRTHSMMGSAEIAQRANRVVRGDTTYCSLLNWLRALSS